MFSGLSSSRRPVPDDRASSYKPVDSRPPRWHSGPVLLDTARLRIRDWTFEDAPTALDIHSRVEVVKWLDDGDRKSVV